MEVSETTSPETNRFFVPFFPHSVNVLASSTNSGKTTLVLNILKHRNLCFARPIDKVLVVLCNTEVDGSVYTNLSSDSLEVEIVFLHEFSPKDHLNVNDLLIFEDVSSLTKDILDCVNVYAHHLDLASVFIVCQSIFLEDEFKTLLSLAHRIFIFFSGTGGTKVAQYIRKFFFVNSELKEYFKTISSFAERHQQIVLFELNAIARKDKSHFLAISGFEHFFNLENYNTTLEKEVEEGDEKTVMSSEKNTPVIFPHLHKQHLYENEYADNKTELDENVGIDPATLPRGSYLLVKAENVTKKTGPKKMTGANGQNAALSKCVTEWNDVNAQIKTHVQLGMKVAHRTDGILLVMSMLNSRHFCVTKDGKSFQIKDEPATSTALIDYLSTATRRSGPNEIPKELYVRVTKLLLNSKTPQAYIKNRALLDAALGISKPVHNSKMKAVGNVSNRPSKRFNPYM